MSHGMGGPWLLLTLVLPWTLSSLPALGWTGLPAQTGIAGVHGDAHARNGVPVPAMDGILSLSAFPLLPVLITLASVLVPTQTDVPGAVGPRFPTRGPPLR